MSEEQEQNPALEHLIRTITSKLEKKGVYTEMVSMNINSVIPVDETQDPVELVKTGAASMLLQFLCSIGDYALKDEVLYPEKAEEEKLFRAVMPLESELKLSEMLSELQALESDEE